MFFFFPLYSPSLLASGWLSPTRRSICNSVFQRVAASILQAEATSTSERLHRDRNILHRQSTSVTDTSQTTQSVLSWSPNTTTPCTLGAHVLFPCKVTHRFLLETSKPAPPRTYKNAPAPARGQTGLKFNP